MTRKETSYGRRLVTAAGFAAALTLGVIGHPAIADAKSKGMDWDTYRSCMNNSEANDINVSVEVCCIQAGGYIVADRTTGRAECWSHEPTPDECKMVIGPNCTRRHSVKSIRRTSILEPEGSDGGDRHFLRLSDF